MWNMAVPEGYALEIMENDGIKVYAGYGKEAASQKQEDKNHVI
jgi:hypothetical protein